MASADTRCAEILKHADGMARIGVEIGVYKGWLSGRLLQHDPSLFLFLIDPWKRVDSPGYLETDDLHHRMTQEDHDKAFAETLNAIKPYAERVAILKMRSLNAAERFEEKSLDFAFIDADHSYEGCRADIEAWWPKIRMGGFLSGHDYRNERGYGVVKAVDEFGGCEFGGNYTWFKHKPWALKQRP